MQPTPPEIPSIDAIEADRKRQEGVTLIDVRERDEWDAAHIPGAQLRPLSTINDWYQDLPTEEPVIVYCRSGSRSADVVRALITQVGLTNLTNLTGGLLAWSRADLPLTAT